VTEDGSSAPIEELGLPVRAYGCLKRAGVNTVGQLQAMSEDDLLSLRNFGLVSLRAVSQALAHNLTKRPSPQMKLRRLPRKVREEARHLSRSRASRSIGLDDPRFGPPIRDLSPSAPSAHDAFNAVLDGSAHGEAQDQAKVIHALAQDLKRARSLSVEEELNDILSAASGTARPQIVMAWLGFEGRGPLTLQEVGDLFGITRERVRQIVAKHQKGVGDRPYAPVLTRSLREIRPMVLADDLEDKLVEGGLTQPGTRMETLLRAAEFLHITTAFRVEQLGLKRALVSDGVLEMVISVTRTSAALCSRWGLSTVAEVEASASNRHGSLGFDARTAIGSIPGVEWLDSERNWFWIRGRRNRLLNNLAKISSVAETLTLGELRSALARHHRSHGFAPPRRILRSLLESTPGHKLTGESVTFENTPSAADILGEVEHAIVSVLQESASGVMPRDELEAKCLARGINRSTFYVYLMYSPLITRFARGVYGLVGSHLEPGEAEQLTPKAKYARVLVDYGWTQDGSIWLGYQLSEYSLLSGILSIPSAMTRFTKGDFVLVSKDGQRLGNLVCSEAQLRGFLGVAVRRGLEGGDFLMVVLRPSDHTALIEYGTEEPWEAMLSVER